MVFAFISKTSFSCLFTRDLNHFWAKYWVDLVDEGPSNVYLRGSSIQQSCSCLGTSNNLSMGEFDKCFWLLHFRVVL